MSFRPKGEIFLRHAKLESHKGDKKFLNRAGAGESERGKAMSAKNAKWANKQFSTKWSKLFAIMMSWFAPISAFAQERSYEWGWGMHPMMWGAWGIGMMFMMLLFWVLVIVGIIVGIRWLLGQRREPQADSALEILRQRYARAGG